MPPKQLPVNDAAIIIPGSKWRPENYSGKIYGPTRLREGLKKSRNLVSINLLREIGIKYTRNYVEPFGFPKKDTPADLTLSLGTGSVTPYQMAAAYSILANGGYQVQPYFITKITDNNGDIIEEHTPKIACKECTKDKANNPVSETAQNETYAPLIMKPYVNYQINSMLKSVARSGTAARTHVLKRNDLAGKTGTTNDQRDAWFCGFTPKKVAVVWIGFDNTQKMGRRETATQLALPAWIDFMKGALKDVEKVSLPVPKGLKAVKIDDYHGFRADSNTLKPITEYLTRAQIPGRIPENFSYSTGGLLANQFVQPVNNPVKPNIILADDLLAGSGLQNFEGLEALEALDASHTNQASVTPPKKTRALKIGNDILEIPEQLF